MHTENLKKSALLRDARKSMEEMIDIKTVEGAIK
jgi:hypothetical protein